MKKIPTLFVRKFENHKVVGITDEITPGCEEAFKRGRATIKTDGACCAVIDGELYKRYDAKKGKNPPEGAIPCCDPDLVTGHWPHWVKVDKNNPADRWFVEAYNNYFSHIAVFDGTFEALGPHFNGNPYDLLYDTMHMHGTIEIDVDRDFESISDYLNSHREEGLVFWLDDEPVCKIKRTDFGYEWPIKIKNKGEKK